jgi:DNA (cytosine-5)-methyltransferase 1
LCLSVSRVKCQISNQQKSLKGFGVKLSPADALQQIYMEAVQLLENNKLADFSARFNLEQNAWLNEFTNHPESRKGVLTVLITSLFKKVISPEQDIRLHQEKMPGGYSGRTLDTKFVTPFLRKVRFPHMEESGWLTRSLEQPHPYNLNYPGNISPAARKESFLRLINEAQTNSLLANDFLLFLFAKLEQFRLSQVEKPIIRLPDEIKSKISLLQLVKMLDLHFKANYKGVSGAARLPVLAIYSVYQCLIEEVSRYENMKLLQLESHTAADSKSGLTGDITVERFFADGSSQPFESIEVKFGRPITYEMGRSAFQKIRISQVERYYLLSTTDIVERERAKIEELITEVRQQHGCELIVNGVVPTLNYYVRLLKDSSKVLDNYAFNLELDPVIKSEHRSKWNSLLQENLLR